MANVKISELPATTTFTRATAIAPVVVGGITQRVTLKQFSPLVTALDFNAVGDDSTDDTAALQAALSSGASRVFIPAGTYKITAKLALPSNIEVFGEGDSTVIKLYANTAGSYGASSGMFNISGRSNVVVRDLKFDGQRSTYTAVYNDAIWIDWRTVAGSNIHIKRVTVRDVAGGGVQALASSGTASSDLWVEDCDIKDTGNFGIHSQDYISNVWYRRNKVQNWGLTIAERVGITGGRSASNLIISDNLVIGSGSALGSSVHGISMDRCSNATCQGNVVKGTIGFGIEVGIVTNGSVTGNTVTDCVRASIAFSGVQASNERCINISVTGNNMSSGDRQGIFMFITGGTGSVVHENITIASNSINGQTDTSNGFGMQLEFCNKLSIIGNTVYNSGLAGVYLVDCVNHFIDGNTVVNNNCGTIFTVSSITLSGTTATVTTSAPHGYSNGDVITIFGANPAEYNGSPTISNVAATTFDYTTTAGLLTPAVGSIQCTKPNNVAYAGIRVSYPTVTTKNQWAFGRNYVYGNGFREIYDVSVNGFVGLANDCVYLKETKQPRVENLTSGESANILDRAAIFVKNNKFVIAYDNAGTINYATLDLDGSDTSWANGSTTP